jgi:prephenate dehydrogenase
MPPLEPVPAPTGRLWQRVTIVGVGLIGGSIGLGLRKRGLAKDVIGVGRRQASLDEALAVGAIDRGTTDLATGVGDAELIVVSAPVGQIAPLVEQLAAHCPSDALITDAGSTKAEIVERLAGSLPKTVRFVGSHPLAGGEKAGPQWSDAELFAGRKTIVTPGQHSQRADVDAVCGLWRSLGAEVLELSPAEHDRLLAASSHLPHLVAAALAAATPAEALALVARGWLDTTRIAAGEPALWQDIFAANRKNTLEALANFEQTLATFRQALDASDDAELARLLAVGQRNRERLSNGG